MIRRGDIPRQAARLVAHNGWSRSLLAMGVAIGGFFDGIVLHQILQWHHLLSLVPGLDRLALQVLWDGVFHLAVYILALSALWGMWRSRHGALPGHLSLAVLLLGFALWHGVDAVLSHWILGIHRIKVDSAYPLVWDLGWLFAFGLGPVAIALALMRRPPSAGGRAAGGWIAGLGGLVLGLSVWSVQPPAGAPMSAIVFAPWVVPSQAEASLRAVGAQIIWADDAAGVAIVELTHRKRWRLYAHGAILVSGTALPDGCFGWSDA